MVTLGPRSTLSRKPRQNQTKIEEKLKIPTSEFYIRDNYTDEGSECSWLFPVMFPVHCYGKKGHSFILKYCCVPAR